MSNPLRSQKNSIVEIHVSLGTVTKGLSSVKNERDIDASILLHMTKV